MSSSVPSHLTILHPRDPSYAESSRITTDFVISLINIDRERWANRREFFFTTLSFCLSLPNLWRFPYELLTRGHGTFLWLYITFTFLIGYSLLFFEIALGQYSSKGFAKVFAMCPIFEGISYSMALYCVIVSAFYNMLNVYSFRYVFGSIQSPLQYTKCPRILDGIHCFNGSDNQSLTPEKSFFEYEIRGLHGNSRANIASIGILLFLWVLICIAIVRGIRTKRWPSMMFCPFPYIVLTVTLCASFTLKGASAGVSAMFSPRLEDFLNVETWRFAFEQSLVTLGLGMGPLITLGSYSKFQSPAHLDCLVLCACTTLSSLLSGMVLFSTVGIIAHERGQSMENVLKINGYYANVDMHVIHSQLFTRLPFGWSQFLSTLFFFMWCSTGWYSLISYTETFIVAVYSLKTFSTKYKVHTNIALCFLCFVVGCSMAFPRGYKAMLAINRYIIGICVLLITLCEMIGVIYIYGVFQLCDDIEFMLGFYPNTYYQITWICSPAILFLAMSYLIYKELQEAKDIYDIVILVVVVLFIIGPILLRGSYNTYKCYKNGRLNNVCRPREVILTDSEDLGGVLQKVYESGEDRNIQHKNVVSFNTRGGSGRYSYNSKTNND